MYTCGPTVYDYVTIGNYRTYMLGDILYRTLKYFDYPVKYIMNITDVGHLTGDNEGDADIGDDRMETSVKKEGKTAQEIADFYTKDFMKYFKVLNMKEPSKFTRATSYIDQMIELIVDLEDKGCTYQTEDGIYFDSSKYERYGQLSGLTSDSVMEGARVESTVRKKNPTDFALWKLSRGKEQRAQEWNSPWGVGFPGWHIECSAMCLEELGETVDIHVGGEDLKMIHHQNEIAQSESATGKKFVNYWVHGAFLQVDGGRMGKSLGNAYTMEDVVEKGFIPLSMRYFYLTAHYRSSLNFTWTALESAQNSLKKIYTLVSGYAEDPGAKVSVDYMSRFDAALNSDVNMPEALAVLWDLFKSDVSEESKVATVVEMDKVLGLRMSEHIGFEIPKDIQNMAATREEYRKAGIWDKADMLRRKIEEKGYVVEDHSSGMYRVKRKL